MNNIKYLYDFINSLEDPKYRIYVAFGFLLCMFLSLFCSISFDLIDYIYKKIKEKKNGK